MKITFKYICQKLCKIVKNPKKTLTILKALLIGSFYIIYYRTITKTVTIKFPFFAFYRVKITGPGSVFIDKNCSVFKNIYEGLTIVTLSKEAQVKIGKGCYLGGLTIYCYKKIEIGNRTITANSLVQDSLFCEINRVKSLFKETDILEPKSVIIGENVWLGALSCILSGTIIGDDSVISFGSVCYKLKVKKYSLVVGNPGVRSLPIRHVLLLSEKQ